MVGEGRRADGEGNYLWPLGKNGMKNEAEGKERVRRGLDGIGQW